MLCPMEHKLEDYQRAALNKAVYLCAAVLDPRQKLEAFTSTTLETLNSDIEDIKDIIISHASKFEDEDKADSDLEIVSPEASMDQEEGPNCFIKVKPVCRRQMK